MQGAQPLPPIVAPPGRLAVDREDRLLHAGRRRGLARNDWQPGGETGLKGGGLQQHQDAAKDVLARDPIGQVEHPREELFLQGRPLGDRRRPVGAGQDRHQGDDDDADQGMLAIDRAARVLQVLEVSCDLVQTDPPFIRHSSSSVGCRNRSDPENDRQEITGRKLNPDCQNCLKLALALARDAHGAAGKGRGRKRMPAINRPDRG